MTNYTDLVALLKEHEGRSEDARYQYEVLDKIRAVLSDLGAT